MKGSCELCSNQARIFCESDQARLCWSCDEKVHCANFLVEKHCRSLLCHVCYTTTPWTASGPKLGPTISVCQSCFRARGCDESNPRIEEEINQPGRRDQENDEVSDSGSGDYGSYSSCSDSDEDDEDDDDDDDESVGDEEDEGENQVVPWSCCSSTSGIDCNQPPVESCSSSEELGGHGGGAIVSLTSKRVRGATNLDSDDEDGCSSKLNHNATKIMECGMTSSSSLKPMKIAKTNELIQQIQDEISEPKRRRLGVLSSIVRFQQKNSGRSG